MDSPLIVDSNQSSTPQPAEQSTTQDQSKPVIKYVIIAFVVVIVLVVLYQGYCAWTASEDDCPVEPAKVTTTSKKVAECDDPDFDLEAELNDLRDKQKKILDKCSNL